MGTGTLIQNSICSRPFAQGTCSKLFRIHFFRIQSITCTDFTVQYSCTFENSAIQEHPTIFFGVPFIALTFRMYAPYKFLTKSQDIFFWTEQTNTDRNSTLMQVGIKWVPIKHWTSLQFVN